MADTSNADPTGLQVTPSALKKPLTLWLTLTIFSQTVSPEVTPVSWRVWS